MRDRRPRGLEVCGKFRARAREAEDDFSRSRARKPARTDGREGPSMHAQTPRRARNTRLLLGQQRPSVSASYTPARLVAYSRADLGNSFPYWGANWRRYGARPTRVTLRASYDARDL